MMPTYFSHGKHIVADFTQFEMDLYRKVAEGRYYPKRNAGVVDRLVAVHLDRIENDLLGLMGEAAVAGLLGLSIDASDSIQGDGGVTDFMKCGYRIQVKTTWHKHGGLLFRNRDAFKADIGILATVDKKIEKSVSLVGWTLRNTFHNHAENRSLGGYGLSAYLEQAKLYPIDSLKPYLEF